MNYKFFTNSEKAWKSMFETMFYAKKSIYMEMYIFQDDIAEFDFLGLLKEKAKQGLQVKLIIDSLGSAGLASNAVAELKNSGVEVLVMSYLLHRMHRKLLVVDEKIAFVGGVNIYKTARFWNDLMVQVRGALVRKLVLSFAKSYRNAGGKDPILVSKKNKLNLEKVDTWIVEHSPVVKKYHLKKAYTKYLNNAQKSITLVTPYFIPKRWLRVALHQAVLRGVNVEVLVPKRSDQFYTDRVTYFYVYKLCKLGVKFYMEETMNHAKAIIIDKKQAMVGSQNLDIFSFDLNSELGVFFQNQSAVTKLENIIASWKKDSTLFDYKTYKPSWFDYVVSPIINLMSLFYRIF